jgi:hypothetical protein
MTRESVRHLGAAAARCLAAWLHCLTDSRCSTMLGCSALHLGSAASPDSARWPVAAARSRRVERACQCASCTLSCRQWRSFSGANAGQCAAAQSESQSTAHSGAGTVRGAGQGTCIRPDAAHAMHAHAAGAHAVHQGQARQGKQLGQHTPLPACILAHAYQTQPQGACGRSALPVSVAMAVASAAGGASCLTLAIFVGLVSTAAASSKLAAAASEASLQTVWSGAGVGASGGENADPTSAAAVGGAGLQASPGPVVDPSRCRFRGSSIGRAVRAAGASLGDCVGLWRAEGSAAKGSRPRSHATGRLPARTWAAASVAC